MDCFDKPILKATRMVIESLQQLIVVSVRQTMSPRLAAFWVGVFGCLSSSGPVSAEELKPGVYVAARDLQGAAVVGTHQFVIMVPKDAAKFEDCRDLGNGALGLIVSTIKRNDRLQVELFDPGDWQATREFTNPGKFVSTFKPDFDTEVAGVNLGAIEIDAAIATLRKSIGHYVSAEAKRNLAYPSNTVSLKNGADLLNSNSWAQSLIEHSFGKGKVREDFSGADNGHQNRIAAEYFK